MLSESDTGVYQRRSWASMPQENASNYYPTASRTPGNVYPTSSRTQKPKYSAKDKRYTYGGSIADFRSNRTSQYPYSNSLEHLYSPKPSRILRNFAVHLTSPFIFAGDILDGQVTFEVLAAANLIQLNCIFEGKATLEYSQNNVQEKSVTDTVYSDKVLLVSAQHSMALEPGRYTFDIKFVLPPTLPCTNELGGLSGDKDIQIKVAYSAVASISMTINGLNGIPLSIVTPSSPCFCRVETKLGFSQLASIDYPIYVNKNKSQIRVSMERNIYRPGDIIEVELIAERDAPGFRGVEAEIIQYFSVPSLHHKQTLAVCPLVSNSGFMAQSRSICCQIHLPITLKPECNIALVTMAYSLIIRIQYRGKRVLTVNIPLRIVNVLRPSKHRRLSYKSDDLDSNQANGIIPGIRPNGGASTMSLSNGEVLTPPRPLSFGSVEQHQSLAKITHFTKPESNNNCSVM